MKKTFRVGDYVRWKYLHHLNSVSTTWIAKIGVYYGRVAHRRGYRGPQLARVKFEGNIAPSKVPESELE